MHVSPQSWRELVYWQDTLSAAHCRPAEEGGRRKDKLHLQESMFLLSVGRIRCLPSFTAMSDDTCAKPLGKALCCTGWHQGHSELNVSQHWQTKKHCLCPLQPGPQMPSTSGLVAPPWRMPMRKTVQSRGKWSAAGYLRSFQVLPFSFPLARQGAGTDKPLPGVKPFPPCMLNRTHCTLVWRQAVIWG